MGCTRRCLSPPCSLYRAHACCTAVVGAIAAHSVISSSFLPPGTPFFPPSRFFATPSSRLTRLPRARVCPGSFSPSFSSHVCRLPVGIHPSVGIAITEEFYRGRPVRCSLLIKAFSACIRCDSPVSSLFVSTFLCDAFPCVESVDAS